VTERGWRHNTPRLVSPLALVALVPPLD